jgi:uncharacterized protein YrrD
MAGSRGQGPTEGGVQSFKKAQGMQVAALVEGSFVGKLDDFQFDLETGAIYGYRLKQGVFAKSGGVPAARLVRLGKDLVFVTEEAAVEWTGAPRAAVEGRAWASEYKGTRVMSRRGAGLGNVEDFLLEADPPRVRALVLDGGRVAKVDEHVAIGRDAVILDDPSAAVAPPAESEDGGDWWSRVRGMFETEK